MSADSTRIQEEKKYTMTQPTITQLAAPATGWQSKDSSGNNPVTFANKPALYGRLTKSQGHGWLVLGTTQWAYYPSSSIGSFSQGTVTTSTTPPSLNGTITTDDATLTSMTYTFDRNTLDLKCTSTPKAADDGTTDETYTAVAITY